MKNGNRRESEMIKAQNKLGWMPKFMQKRVVHLISHTLASYAVTIERRIFSLEEDRQVIDEWSAETHKKIQELQTHYDKLILDQGRIEKKVWGIEYEHGLDLPIKAEEFNYSPADIEAVYDQYLERYWNGDYDQFYDDMGKLASKKESKIANDVFSKDGLYCEEELEDIKKDVNLHDWWEYTCGDCANSLLTINDDNRSYVACWNSTRIKKNNNAPDWFPGKMKACENFKSKEEDV